MMSPVKIRVGVLPFNIDAGPNTRQEPLIFFYVPPPEAMRSNFDETLCTALDQRQIMI